MDHTQAQIGNFMDPNSVKARMQITFTSNSVEQSQSSYPSSQHFAGSSSSSAVQKKSNYSSKAAVAKKKSRPKIEGFLQRNDKSSNFKSITDSKPKASQPDPLQHSQLVVKKQKSGGLKRIGGWETPCFSVTVERPA